MGKNRPKVRVDRNPPITPRQLQEAAAALVRDGKASPAILGRRRFAPAERG